VSDRRQDYRVTTAEIVYRLPDHPLLLQTFIWQKLDLAPDYPELRRFLDFWKQNLEGELHSVRVGHVIPAKSGNPEPSAPAGETATRQCRFCDDGG